MGAHVLDRGLSQKEWGGFKYKRLMGTTVDDCPTETIIMNRLLLFFSAYDITHIF